MKTFGKSLLWIGLAALLALCVGTLVAEDLQSELERPATPSAEKVEDAKSPEVVPGPEVEPTQKDLPWTPTLLGEDNLILQNSSCGACNCNEDDDCEVICGRPASCERRICPCATCTGSCQC